MGVKITIFLLMMLMDRPFDEHQLLMILRWCWARACRSDRLQSDIMSARSLAYPWMDSASKEFSKKRRSSTSRLNRNGKYPSLWTTLQNKSCGGVGAEGECHVSMSNIIVYPCDYVTRYIAFSER